MICKNCGFNFEDGAGFCPNCGTPATPPVDNAVNQQIQYQQAPVMPPVNNTVTPQDLPEQYRPLGAWTYFWLQVLFTIPIVGFIFLIIFSINGSNINRRNFARSYWCVLAIVAVLAVTLIAIYATAIGAFMAAY